MRPLSLLMVPRAAPFSSLRFPLFLARDPDSFLFWIVPHSLGSDAILGERASGDHRPCRAHEGAVPSRVG
jgi:hypothetical protein